MDSGDGWDAIAGIQSEFGSSSSNYGETVHSTLDGGVWKQKDGASLDIEQGSSNGSYLGGGDYVSAGKTENISGTISVDGGTKTSYLDVIAGINSNGTWTKAGVSVKGEDWCQTAVRR